MTTPARPEASGLASRQGVFVTLGVACGVFVTDFRPMIGLTVGVVALFGVIVSFAIKRTPPWLAWLMADLAAGVALVFTLALLAGINPTPGSGSGGP